MSNQYLTEPQIENIGLKKMVSLKLNENRSRLAVKEKPNMKEENVNLDSFIRELDSPIKLLENSPVKAEPKSQLYETQSTRHLDPRSPSSALPSPHAIKESSFKVERESTSKTIASIDTILSAIRSTLSKQWSFFYYSLSGWNTHILDSSKLVKGVYNLKWGLWPWW